LRRREKETLKKEARKAIHVGNLDENVREFEVKKKDGPVHVCSCCRGLGFLSATKLIAADCFDKDFVAKIFSVDNGGMRRLCGTCYRDYRLMKVPRLALANGIAFPEIPAVLQDLTTLEERLCALRLPFMQIRSLGVDGQCGLRGNVVHIENDLNLSVAVLPRTEDQSAVIPVGLVRHLDQQRPYLFQEIRPAKVYEAARYLITTPIYREEGAVLSDDWLKESPMVDSCAPHQFDKEFSEPEEVNPGSKESLIIQYSSEEIQIAPGQVKRPMSLIMDLNAEAAAYPTIYGGHARFLPSNMTPMDLWKSETRRYDRRYACFYR
jgi:hypothetical protein